ncbi:MAG TPA: hypothetical protein VFW07_28705 [Parafilimonas sp.]|nr:hypothetical protein [Parafilimonas sp.]
MSSTDNEYKFDRNAFNMMSFEEADNYMRDYKKYTWQERLSISLYLTGIAYNFDISNPPRLDRNAFRLINRN